VFTASSGSTLRGKHCSSYWPC